MIDNVIPLRPVARTVPISDLNGREMELIARYEQLFASIANELAEIAEENNRIFAENEQRIAAIVKRQLGRTNMRVQNLSIECASVALGRNNKTGG